MTNPGKRPGSQEVDGGREVQPPGIQAARGRYQGLTCEMAAARADFPPGEEEASLFIWPD